jgi:hypothetical protein
MPEKAPKTRISEFEETDQTKFACLVAAILTTSVLETDSPSPDKVFQVYGNMIRMIENQAPSLTRETGSRPTPANS